MKTNILVLSKTFTIFFSLVISSISNSQVNITGNLTTYVDNFISSLPSTYGGNDYQPPSSSDLTTWSNVINYILQGHYSSAHSTADGIGYRLVEYTDNSVNPNKKYYILEKKSASTNYWGMFIYNPNAARTKLFIQSPHPKYDSFTGKQGFYIFKSLSCRAFFVTGTHRCNNSNPTTCSGTSQVCTGQDEPYKISDQAHVVNGTLYKCTEILNSNITNLMVIQVHGFSQDPGDPDLIISNGTRNTPDPDYVSVLRGKLLLIDDTLTFKIPHIDLSWTQLIATDNTQGRLINGSSNPCSQAASTSSGRFIHVEQAYNLRNTDAARKKLSDAIGLTFPVDALTLTSPNGNEILISGNVYSIAWTTSGLVNNVRIEYTTDNGASWIPIVASTANTGYYSWTVPYIGTWRAKVRIFDAEYNTIGDSSNSLFKIKHAVYPTTGLTLFVDPASAFGPRKLSGVYDFHRGIDFPGSYNIPIHPALPGVIVRKEDSTVTAGTGLQRFGNWILIRIDSVSGQPLHNAYLHLNGFHRFNVGDTVTTSDTIGFMGKSGYEINTVHLHLELYKNLSGTTIDKDKAKNPIEILPYNNSNSYSINFLTSGDSSAAQISIPETELDFDGITIYGSLSSRTIGFNSRVGIDPVNNDNPSYNNVFIDPVQFIQDSSMQNLKFWTKNNEIGAIDSVNITDVKGYSFTISQSSAGNRYAVVSGNWTGAIWAYTAGGVAGSASTPLNMNDIIINSNVTVTVNTSSAECKSVSFSATTSKFIFSSGSILSVHGDFTLATTTHNAFSSWSSGAKLRFAGNEPIQLIRNLYKDASTFSSSFIELVIDKPLGKVTTEDSVRLNIGSSIDIVSGIMELGYRADIEGRNLTGISSTTPTITIQAGGKFEMIGSLSHIRSGTSSSMNPIGKMTVYGVAILRTTSSLGMSIGGIDVKSGGTLYFDSFTSSYPNLVKTGIVNIENGGKTQINSVVPFWHSASSVNLQSGGNYIINSSPSNVDYSFPLTFTNNGAIEYGYSGNQAIKTLAYCGLKISGSGSKSLNGNITVNENLVINGGNLVTGQYKVTLLSLALLSEINGAKLLGKVNTTRNLTQYNNNSFGGIGVEINALGTSPGSTYIERVNDTVITSCGNSSIKRYFIITPTINNLLNADLIFHYDETELNGIMETDLRLFKSTNSGGTWNYVNGVVNNQYNTITSSGINNFSYWTAADSGAPLSIKTLNLIAFIEGFYNGTTMIPDTITVELHNTFLPYEVIEQIKTVLNSDGATVANSILASDAIPYYLVIKHRNSIQTWSANGQFFTDGILNFNFTTSQNQSYGNNLKNTYGKWCIFNGDVNFDEFIDGSDVSEIFNAAILGTSGYVITDLTGDDFVDGADVSTSYNNSLLGVGAFYPATMLMKKGKNQLENFIHIDE